MRITIIHQPFFTLYSSLNIERYNKSAGNRTSSFFFFSSPSQRTFEGPRKKAEEVAVIPMIEI